MILLTVWIRVVISLVHLLVQSLTCPGNQNDVTHFSATRCIALRKGYLRSAALCQPKVSLVRECVRVSELLESRPNHVLHHDRRPAGQSEGVWPRRRQSFRDLLLVHEAGEAGPARLPLVDRVRDLYAGSSANAFSSSCNKMSAWLLFAKRSPNSRGSL